MLKVLFNNVDISETVENYLVDDYTFILTASGELAIGYYKPISSLYVEMKDYNTVDSKMSLYYYTGSAFTTTSSLKDGTRGFKRSGFITWDRNLSGEVKTTVRGIELFWYKIKLDEDSSQLSVKGINLVFSDDNDLKEEYPSVMDLLPDGETSFIGFHVASRKDILSYMKSQGKLVVKDNGENKLLDQFDLLNIEEVRDASKFLTLSKILLWLSDANDDKWYQKAKDFEEKYNQKINLANLSLDSNDNGKAEQNEIGKIQSIRIVRQ